MLVVVASASGGACQVHQLKAFAAQPDAVPRPERAPLHAIAVDPCAMRALQIDDHPFIAFALDRRVLPRRQAVAEHDIGIGTPADQDARRGQPEYFRTARHLGPLYARRDWRGFGQISTVASKLIPYLTKSANSYIVRHSVLSSVLWGKVSHMIRFSSLLGIVILASAAFAQSDRGTITGTVVDPTGAAIANAPVQAKNSVTGVVYQGATSSTGNYTISQLPAGPYEIIDVRARFQAIHARRIDRRSGAGAAGRHRASGRRFDRVDHRHRGRHAVEHRDRRRAARHPIGDAGRTSGAGNRRRPGGKLRHPQSQRDGEPDSGHVLHRQRGSSRERRAGQHAIVPHRGTGRLQHRHARRGCADAAERRRHSGDCHSDQQLRRGIRAGGRRHVQPHHEIGRQPVSRQRLRILRQRRPERQSAFHQHACARATAATITASRSAGPVWIPKVYKGRDKTFFFFNFEQYREALGINNQLETVPTAAYRQGNFATAIPTGAAPIGTLPNGQPILQGEIFDPTSVNQGGPNGTLSHAISRTTQFRKASGTRLRSRSRISFRSRLDPMPTGS